MDTIYPKNNKKHTSLDLKELFNLSLISLYTHLILFKKWFTD